MGINPVLQTGLLNQSSAQVIDGSVLIDGHFGGSYPGKVLERTPSSVGNNKTWTLSYWFKKVDNGAAQEQMFVAGTGPSVRTQLYFNDHTLRAYHTESPEGTNSFILQSYLSPAPRYRDFGPGWYHICWVSDIPNGTFKCYVNNVLDINGSVNTSYITQVNLAHKHTIGNHSFSDYNNPFTGRLSQMYMIDGQALDPSYFGFTDPLTNTWRPKKYTGTFTQSSPNNGTTWTNNTTSGSGTIGNAYDGASNTWCNITSGNTFTLTPPSTIVADTVEVWLDTDTPASFSINGGTFSSENTYSGLQFVSVATDVSLTSLAIKGGSGGSGIGLRGIRINGEILLDGFNNTGANSFYLPFDGSSPIGEDKSGIVTPNNGSIWSASLFSSSGFRSSEPKTNAFDGNTSSICSAVGSGTITFTSPVTFASNSTIRVFLHGGDHTVTVNGGSNQTISAGSFQTVTYSNSGNATFTMTFHRGGGADTGVRAIEIDGVILTDGQIGNNWTPVNFGSGALEKATGAKPILNTIQGGTQAGVGVFGSKEGFHKTVNSTSGGGNPYIFDTAGGTSTQPTLNMLRGATYSFDYSSATGHPLYFSSLSDGKHNSKAYSVQFDGTDDRLAVGSSSDYAFGTGDFTIEMFVYHTSLTGQQTYFSDAYGDNDGVYFYKTSTNTLSLYDNNNQVFTSGTIELNKWHHIALSRTSGVVRGFIDGAQVAVVADSHNYTETQYNIGDSHGSSSGEMVGYISNVRVLKGTGLYNSSFTPPQTTLTNITNTVLLCCQDSDATTAVVVPSGQSITTAGNPSATNSHNPFLYDNNHGNFGVNTATSNTTKFTVPHLAVDTLYYYCTNHSGMGNSISVTTDETKADPYAWKCVLAMPLLGNKNDVSASINVNSTTKTTAITGNTQGVNNTSVFYGGSFVFDGNSDYIQITPTDSSTLADNLGPYTIEFFFNIDSARLTDNTYNLMWSTSSGLSIAKWRSGISNKVYFESDGNATGWNITSNEDILANNWYHFAAVRDGNTIKTYLNGVLQGTKTATYTASAETWWRVGGQNANSSTHDGYIQDFRIYRGVAKYTSNFMPPSTNPDILPDTPSGVSGSSKLTKIIDGAVNFDGTDYLTVADGSNDFSFGTGAYTVEGYLYPTTLTGNGDANPRFFCCGTPSASSNRNQLQIVITASGRIRLDTNGANYQSSDGDVVANKWQHIAVARDGSGNLKAFVDGRQVLSQTSVNNDITNNDGISLGIEAGVSSRFTGFMSNVRILKGTALYTSSFTPPTEPLTNVTNTKLLCCQSNTSATAVAAAPNLSAINDGTHWSGATVTGSNATFSNLFDGDNTTSAQQATLGVQVSVTDFGPVSVASSVSFYSPDGPATYTLNGGSNQVFSSTGYHTINFSGTLNQFTWIGDNARIYIYGMQVDGTDLVDIITPNGDAAATTFNPFTTDINAVRGQETGYATLNLLAVEGGATYSDGNLKVTGSAAYRSTPSTIGMSEGKWYVEYFFDTWVNDSHVGVMNDISPATTGTWAGNTSNGFAWAGDTGDLWTGGSTYNSSFDVSFGTGDTCQIAFDADSGRMYFGKNGLWLKGANPSTGSGAHWPGLTNGPYYPFVTTTNGTICTANFGQKPFKYAPPEGYQSLNAANTRPETVIARPDQYFNMTTWSGNNADPRQIDLGMAPDMIWVKTRNQTNWPWLSDSLRGTADKRYKIYSNSNSAQDTAPIYGQADSLNDSGFVVGGGTDGSNPLSDSNQTGTNYVCWSWRAGGNKGTFNVDGEGYASASDVNMSVGSTRSADAVSSGNDYSAGYAGHSPVGTWVDSDSWSGLPAYSSGQKGYFSGTETLSNGSVISAAANPKPFSAVVNGSQGFVLRASTTVTLRLLVQSNVTEIATTSSDSQTFGNRTIVATNPTSGTYVEATGKCFWWSGNSNYPSISIMGTLYDAPAQPSIANIGASVGTKQGFSILKYTGSGSNGTIAHGLSQAPDFFFGRDLDDTGGSRDWIIYHKEIGATGRLKFNQNGTSTASAFFQDTSPTNSVITVGTSNDINSTNDYILYCWHDVPGLQKFGSYGGADAFVELGFRPALLIIKSLSGSRNWILIDNARDTVNPSQTALLPNDNAVEDDNSVYAIDFLSNGFKIRGSNGQIDGDTTYVYAAWAEAPAFNLYGAQSNAR